MGIKAELKAQVRDPVQVRVAHTGITGRHRFACVGWWWQDPLTEHTQQIAIAAVG